jgi:hypothetical protein
MRTRPTTVLATALALLAIAPLSASAQDPSPTATPTATPSASSADAKTDWPKDVQRVYDDYRRDGVIDVCKHTQKTLQDTLDTIEPAYDQDYPDFREAISAGIARHKSGRCADATPTATPTSSAGATGTSTPAPSATPGTSAGAESGALPKSDGGGGGAGATPPSDQIPPAGATVTPAPATAAPSATPPPPTAAVTPAGQVIVRSGHRSLAVPAILLAIALLGAAALAVSAFATRRNPRLHHAWREAAFRTRGTWADFSDWLRLGR